MTHGLLIIDKPLGMTSHDVVGRVRKLLGTRKVGHAGTLDPEASGVLVVCVGDATRLLEYLTANHKAYKAMVSFGASTDTDDASGRVLYQQSAAELTESAVHEALSAFTGEIVQQVPMFSAVHIDGERAYDLARRGEVFDAPSRIVHIHELKLCSFEPGETALAKLSIACSKGTYIRSLARDLGRHIGIPAHLSALRRTSSGAFHIESAISLETLGGLADPSMALLPTEIGVQDLPQIRVDEREQQRLTVGQTIPFATAATPRDAETGAIVAAMTADGRLVAVGTVTVQDGASSFKPRKVFWKKDR
jgi:tRNA pseudouridine55 synthase